MAYDNNFGGSRYASNPTVTVKIGGETVDGDLYADQAKRAAEACDTGNKTGPNASPQLRRFYDELVMWHDKVFAKQTPQERSDAFREFLPYIQMLRAKAAYSKGRNLVDETFFHLFDDLIAQVKTPETLKRARLFFEAFLGFKKYLENK